MVLHDVWSGQSVHFLMHTIIIHSIEWVGGTTICQFAGSKSTPDLEMTKYTQRGCSS